MSLFGGLGSALGGIVGSVVPGVGTALGATIGGGLGSAAGSLTGAAGAASAGQNPLTGYAAGLGTLYGALGYSLGNYGNLLTSSQLSALSEALDRSRTATSVQAQEILGQIQAGTDLYKQLGQAKLATELLGPQFLNFAGQEKLKGENQLALDLGMTNTDLKALQGATRIGVAEKAANALSDAFSMRAKTEGALALGAQNLSNNLKLTQASAFADAYRTKAQTEGALALRRDGRSAAFAGTKYFA